jgi:hypothetical protein
MLGKYTRADIDAQFRKCLFDNEKLETIEPFTEDTVDNPNNIQVDWENTSFYDKDAIKESWNGAGWQEVNGSPVYVGWVGGDWEEPVALIFYLNENGKLRAYHPKEGNIFNYDTNEALGNDEEADEAFCKSERRPSWFPTWDKVDDSWNDFHFNIPLLLKDFENYVSK